MNYVSDFDGSIVLPQMMLMLNFNFVKHIYLIKCSKTVPSGVGKDYYNRISMSLKL
jgi:hypothetical protein